MAIRTDDNATIDAPKIDPEKERRDSGADRNKPSAAKARAKMLEKIGAKETASK